MTDAMLSPDGRWILTRSTEDGAVRLWDDQGTMITVLDRHSSGIRQDQFSPTGEQFMTISADGIAELRRLDGTLIARLGIDPDDSPYAWFNANGSHIVTSSLNGFADVWDRTGQHLFRVNDARQVLFSDDGLLVGTVSGDGIAQLWDLNGHHLATLQESSETVRRILFSHDSQSIFTIDDEGKTRLWDGDGTYRMSFLGVFITLDTSRFFLLTVDLTMEIWDTQGTRLTQITTRQGFLSSMAVAVSGDQIAMEGINDTIGIWNTSTGVLQTTFTDPDIKYVDFSSDGRLLLFTTRTGESYLTFTDTTDLLRVAGCRVSRDLTPEEQQLFNLPAPRFKKSDHACPQP